MSDPFTRQTQEVASLSSIPRWATDLDIKLDLILQILQGNQETEVSDPLPHALDRRGTTGDQNEF